MSTRCWCATWQPPRAAGSCGVNGALSTGGGDQRCRGELSVRHQRRRCDRRHGDPRFERQPSPMDTFAAGDGATRRRSADRGREFVRRRFLHERQWRRARLVDIRRVRVQDVPVGRWNGAEADRRVGARTRERGRDAVRPVRRAARRHLAEQQAVVPRRPPAAQPSNSTNPSSAFRAGTPWSTTHARWPPTAPSWATRS